MRHLPKLLAFFILTVLAVPAFYLLVEKVMGDTIPAAYADVPETGGSELGTGCGCSSGSSGSSGSCCAD